MHSPFIITYSFYFRFFSFTFIRPRLYILKKMKICHKYINETNIKETIINYWKYFPCVRNSMLIPIETKFWMQFMYIHHWTFLDQNKQTVKVCIHSTGLKLKKLPIFTWSHKRSSVVAWSVFLFRVTSGWMDGRNVIISLVSLKLSRLIETAPGARGDRTEHNSVQRLPSRFVLFTGVCEPRQRPGHGLTQLARFSIQPCHGLHPSARLINERPCGVIFCGGHKLMI